MKKLVSLLLVIIMLCPLVSGCDWNGLIDYITHSTAAPKWEAPEGVIETATVDENGNSITIAHSENFTQDDIDFVIHLHGTKMGSDNSSLIVTYGFSDIIRNAQEGVPWFLMHFENPYIVVAYLKADAEKYEYNEFGHYVFEATKYVWYKFAIDEAIPENVGNNIKTYYSYLLYDCIIREDIANGVEYNRKCKAYLNYRDESTLETMSENMLSFHYTQNIGKSESKFIKESSDRVTRYEIYTDDKGKEYFIFPQKVIYEDGTVTEGGGKYYFEEYYDILYPYFEIFDELDFHTVSNDGQNIIRKYAGINLETFTNILFMRDKNENE